MAGEFYKTQQQQYQLYSNNIERRRTLFPVFNVFIIRLYFFKRNS